MSAGVSPMRPGIASAAFVAAMLAGSGLTLLRMLVVAALLTTANFGTYAAVVAGAAFLGSVISFGAVEATIKAFPRLVERGQRSAMIASGRAITGTVLVRSLAGVPIAAIGWATGQPWVLAAGIAVVLAFGTSYTSILASMQRAAGRPNQLVGGTLLRAGGVFAAVVAAALTGSLEIVLIAEFAATVLTSLVSQWLFFSASRDPTDEQAGAEASPAGPGADGLRLFAAYTLVAGPFYLDRMFVGATLGLERAGQYAMLALLLTAATLLINTIAQRVGPDAIRLATSPGGQAAAGRLVALWCAVTSGLWLTGMVFVALVVELDLLPSDFARYRLDTGLLVPIAASGVLLNTGLIEFLLIALDKERAFLRAAIAFAAATVLMAALIAWLDASLTAFLWGLAACRLVYAVALVSALRSSPSATTG